MDDVELAARSSTRRRTIRRSSSSATAWWYRSRCLLGVGLLFSQLRAASARAPPSCCSGCVWLAPYGGGRRVWSVSAIGTQNGASPGVLLLRHHHFLVDRGRDALPAAYLSLPRRAGGSVPGG